MKFFISILIISFSLFIFGCGEKLDEMKQAMDVVQKAPEIAEKMEKSANAAEAKRKERIAKGDTLAMNYTELQKYLPTSVSGYTAEEPQGESMNMGTFSMSNAKIRFTKPSSNGNDYVEVELVDYNQAYEMYIGMTFWSAGFKVENNERLEQTFETGIKNSMGYETYQKKTKNAEVTYALGWRFILHLKANNIDNINFLKSIANSMKLSELANK